MSSAFNNYSFPLKVEGLTVAYAPNPPILNNVGFEVRAGEIFGILGGSGCGKSSLLRHIIGLERPIGGQVFIFGQKMNLDDEVQLNSLRQRFGMMYQAGALFGSLSLLENVALPLTEFTDLNPKVIENAARMKLSLVGLDGFEHHLPAHISGGMQKRAAIARAMALDPKLIFLDEPSAGLDPVTAAGLDNLIETLADNLGIAFVMVTHELRSIMAIVDRAIMLDRSAKGIIAEGPPADLAKMDQPAQVAAFFRPR